MSTNKPAQLSTTCGADLVATGRHYAIPRKAAIGSVVDTVTPAAGASLSVHARVLLDSTLAGAFAGLSSSRQLFSTVDLLVQVLSECELRFCVCWHESELCRGHTTHKPQSVPSPSKKG